MRDASPPVISRPSPSTAIIEELTGGFRETAESVVPWFLQQMPPMYFQDTDHRTQLSHLRAIIAAKASNRPIELTLRSEDGSQWTLMRPLDYPGVLAEMVSELPHDRNLRSAKIHTANDGKLVLDTFEFGETERYNPNDPDQAKKLKQTIEYARKHMPSWPAEAIAEHFKKCSSEYVLTVTPLRICKQYELFKQLSGTDAASVTLEPESNPKQSRIIVAAGNATARTLLERIARRLARSQIKIHRAYLDIIDEGPLGTISLQGFVVQDPSGGPLDENSEVWQNVKRDLTRIKWLDQAALDLADRHSELDITTAEIIVALCHLVHQKLCKVNPYAFDRDRIMKLAERNRLVAIKVVNLFLQRFDPQVRLDDERFAQRCAELRAEINSAVDHEDARTVIESFVEAVESVLRTNVFLESRYALSMRLKPEFMATKERPELPYGVFFVHGRAFDGFHVRFRDIARGGVRAVRPIGVDQYAREVERLYDEAYGLAFAQQLKNKDIPEGGAKAAILLEPDAQIPRSVKGFIDGMLDLITPEPETQKKVIDLLGVQELLYFGPDENITPQLIDWIVDRAKRRGYPTPTALMSSKPGAGINHKTYGVTSEGVQVFLDVALKHLAYDGRVRPFTIKITGGPDGDVAGNMIKILHREYGENAKIVGIADGSGSGEDPDGLQHEELLRLVKAELPISHFERAKLGPKGRIVAVSEPDGVQLRNTLHNRVVADAFLPAGGRPATMHAGNWKAFLTPDGRPSSPLIVEGANLFLTPEARRELSDLGVVIFKDSSANKCGVITSSYEIIASMLLAEEEFLKIKERFVPQVLEKLRGFARREAELLLRIYRHHPQIPLPEVSVRISRVMIRASDAVEAAIDSATPEDTALLRQLVIDHMPAILVETAGERLWTKTPPAYLKWIMAKSLISRVVYREGFEYLESMPIGAIANLAFRYLRVEQESRRLVGEVRNSKLEHRDRVAELLEHGGLLTGLSMG